MGMGSLKRIAALCTLATTAVLAGGAISAPAQLSVPSTSVTTPTVTVPSTTVRVPSTTTTVTTPPVKVTAPKPVVKSPAVTAPVPKAPAPVSKPVQKVTKTISPSAGSGGGAVKKTLDTASKVGGTSGGSSSGGGSLDVGGAVGGLTGGLTTASGAVGGRSGGIVSSGTGQDAGTGLVRGPGGMTFLAGPGGGGGTPGGPGAFPGAGSGGGFGGPGTTGGGRSLSSMLAGAGAKELRSVLEQLEGCLPALAAVDRRVISLRAGLAGSPLTRAQVGRQLGLSRTAVRNSERRALNRLQYAAATTGCAGAVVGPFDPAGIGNLSPQLVLAGAVPVHTSGVSGDFTEARGIVGRSASPLFGLDGGGQGGPAWAIILFTVLLSVSVAALTRELRQSI